MEKHLFRLTGDSTVKAVAKRMALNWETVKDAEIRYIRGLLRKRDLNHVIAGRPSANHVDESGAAGVLEKSSQRLAVDGHDLALREPCHGQNLLPKRFPQGIRIQRREHPRECVVGGNAGVQADERSQPGFPRAAVGLDGTKGVGATDHGTQREREYVRQRVVPGPLHARIRYAREVP